MQLKNKTLLKKFAMTSNKLGKFTNPLDTEQCQ